MNEIESVFGKTVEWLQKLNGMPAIALCLLACLVLGYILRFIQAFPNHAVPLAVILFGGLVYPMIADDNNEITLRVWLVRNALIGLVVGFSAWVFHNQVLKRIEGKVFSPDTTFMDKAVPPKE